MKLVTVSGCGEVVDGKDVPSQIAESKPSGVFGSGLVHATTASPFGASNKSPFGAPSESPFGSTPTAAAPKPGGAFAFGQNASSSGSAFTFGQAKAPTTGAFAFGKNPTPAFGASSSQNDGAGGSLFSSGTGSTSAVTPSIFSFGNSNAAPSFGSLSASQSQTKPFSFGDKK